jgi:hypothetical protein
LFVPSHSQPRCRHRAWLYEGRTTRRGGHDDRTQEVIEPLESIVEAVRRTVGGGTKKANRVAKKTTTKTTKRKTTKKR